MAEFLVRATSQDAALMRRIYGGATDATQAISTPPNRIVIDAHTATTSAGADIAATARTAGVPLLIDPQTFYLQDRQHTEDDWAKLKFASAEVATPADLSSPVVQDRLIDEAIQFQLEHHATAIIPPYVHIASLSAESWIGIQATLWRRTRRYLDVQQLALPVVAVKSVGWRAMHPVQGPAVLSSALAALAFLEPTEVGLAVSKCAAGVRPEDRVMDLVLHIERLRERHRVILWEEGRLGDLAIAAGAVGYECGVGTREELDVTSFSARRRRPDTPGPRQPRGVYIPTLGRSIPKRSVTTIKGTSRSLWAQLMCADTDCCPPAGQALLGDARRHAIVQRTQRTSDLSAIARSNWRWHQLFTDAHAGIELARRINKAASSTDGLSKVDTSALRAIKMISNKRRFDARVRHVA